MLRVVCSLGLAFLALGCEDPGCLRHSECQAGYECKDSRCVKIPVDAGPKAGSGGAGGKGGKGGLIGATQDAGAKKATGGTSGSSTSMDASTPDNTDMSAGGDTSGGAGGTM
jgi:hypothetical protein